MWRHRTGIYSSKHSHAIHLIGDGWTLSKKLRYTSSIITSHLPLPMYLPYTVPIIRTIVFLCIRSTGNTYPAITIYWNAYAFRGQRLTALNRVHFLHVIACAVYLLHVCLPAAAEVVSTFYFFLGTLRKKNTRYICM